jgi:hypothetical protein
MAMRERIIRVFYNDDGGVPKFASDEHCNTFYHALGRMAAYSMWSDAVEPTLQIVDMSVDKNREITCAYGERMPSRVPGSYENNKKFYTLDDALSAMRSEHRPFVMGAVPRDDGLRYSFHS